MLKLFPGNNEIIGTIIIPTAIMVVMLLIPLFDRVLPNKLAHFLACGFVFALVGGAGYLTYQAWQGDAHDKFFQASRAKADEARQRVLKLAGDPAVGIPPEGAAYVLLRDPLTHGRGVLDAKCLVCHDFDGKAQGTQVASDLKDLVRTPGSAACLRPPSRPPTSARFRSATAWPSGSRTPSSRSSSSTTSPGSSPRSPRSRPICRPMSGSTARASRTIRDRRYS